MMKRSWLLVLLLSLGAACGKKHDDSCQQIVDKISTVMIADGVAKADDPAERARGVAECRDHEAETKNSAQGKCILAASSTEDIRTCMNGYTKKVQGEAKFQLHRIGTAAKRVLAERGSFPKGTAKQLPVAPTAGAAGCCGGPSFQCAASTEWASDPVWKELGFTIDEPTQYEYSYESLDGTSFKATAVGDRDCDETIATYTLTGKANGKETTVDLAEPPRGTY
jgi:hypothetical protein